MMKLNGVYFIFSLIFCSSVEDIKSQAQWDGINGTSRQQLLVDLQSK